MDPRRLVGQFAMASWLRDFVAGKAGLSRRTIDSELLHAAAQRVGMQIENLRCPSVAFNHPVCFLQKRFGCAAVRLARANEIVDGAIRLVRPKPKPTTSSVDAIAVWPRAGDRRLVSMSGRVTRPRHLDNVLQLTNVSWPS